MSNPDDTQPVPPEVPTPADPPLAPVQWTSASSASVLPPPPPPAAWPGVAPAAPTPPPSPIAAPPRAGTRESRRRPLTALAIAALLAMATIVGYSFGSDKNTSSSNATSSFPTQQQIPNGSSNGSSSGSSNGSSSNSGNGQQTNIDLQAIANKVSPSVVNLTSTVDGGEAAGTGIIISSSGLVLTNNHVIAQSQNLQAELNGDGEFHDVKVLGYDLEHDVALVQIQDVSGLTPATLGDSSSVETGDVIVALGNAGGKGGDPTVVSGSVTDTGQQITASDQDGSNAETLTNLIQIDANIQPGDSGGALVNSDGAVIGMNAAAASGNGSFRLGGGAANEGYAIPIEDALAIAKKIQAETGGDTIHIGAHAGVMGVAVTDDSSGNVGPFGGSSRNGNGTGGSDGTGAYVQGVQSGSGAAGAGITEGSMITSIDGKSVSSASELTHKMVPYQPGDKVKVQWVDSSDQTHTATVTLGSAAPN